jgi:hypothetical protein
MKQYQKQLIKDRNQLLKQLNALKKFISENPVFPTLSSMEQEQIHKQISIMQDYEDILTSRISAFDENIGEQKAAIEILIRGLPCSGKSEIMQLISHALVSQGMNVECYTGEYMPQRKLQNDFRDLNGPYDNRLIAIVEKHGDEPFAVDHVRPGIEYHLAIEFEKVLREHMTNYGGVGYAETTINNIKSKFGLDGHEEND